MEDKLFIKKESQACKESGILFFNRWSPLHTYTYLFQSGVECVHVTKMQKGREVDPGIRFNERQTFL